MSRCLAPIDSQLLPHLAEELLARRDQELVPALLSELGFLDHYLRSPEMTHEAYSRTVLLSTPELEVMVASWRQGHECMPHDHGYSEGCVVNLLGRFKETSYAFEGEQLIKTGEAFHQNLYSLMDVDTARVHSMHCVDKEGLTLHIYSPAIDNMKVFDPSVRRTLTVANNCGAWIPVDQKQILKEQFWFSAETLRG